MLGVVLETNFLSLKTRNVVSNVLSLMSFSKTKCFILMHEFFALEKILSCLEYYI